jgi:hypothetical protein
MTEHYSHVTIEEKNRTLTLALLPTNPVVSTSAGAHPSKTADSPQQSQANAVQ